MGGQPKWVFTVRIPSDEHSPAIPSSILSLVDTDFDFTSIACLQLVTGTLRIGMVGWTNILLRTSDLHSELDIP